MFGDNRNVIFPAAMTNMREANAFAGDMAMAKFFAALVVGSCSMTLFACTQTVAQHEKPRGDYALIGGRPSSADVPESQNQASQPALQPSDGAEPVMLPALDIPVRDPWSSRNCRDLAVTFSGQSQPMQTSPSALVSFDEAREFHTNAYYEMAECFCAKTADLSEITEPAADRVTKRTAQQLSQIMHVRIARLTFNYTYRLGNYSEITGSSTSQPGEILTLRTYWRGPCSMRLATMAAPDSALRATEFLNSIQETGLAPVEVAERQAVADPGAAYALPPQDMAKKLEQYRAMGLLTPEEYDYVRREMATSQH